MKTLSVALLASLTLACAASQPSDGAGFNIGAEAKETGEFRFGRFSATAPRGYEVGQVNERAVLMVREGAMMAALDLDVEADAREPEGCAGYVHGFATGFLRNMLEDETLEVEPTSFGSRPGGCGFEGVTGEHKGAGVVTSVLQRPEAFAVVFCFSRVDDFNARSECAALQASVR